MAVEKITSEKVLEERISHCGKCLEKKFHCEPGHKAIVVCGGTGCLSSDSQGILDRFQELIKEKGVEGKVTANIVGCFGFCSQGPFVKIFPEETLYTKVKVKDVDEIFEKDILGGQIVDRLLFVDPQTKEHVQKQHDIAFYKLQRRDIALRGNGEINPEDVNEALGMGAFQGLNRALHMSRKEVIDEVLKSGLSQTLFQFLTHLLGPRLCTKHAHFQLKLVAAPWALFHGLAQEHSVAGGTAQNGGAKVVHQGHLLLGVT